MTYFIYITISIWNHCNHPASSGFIYLFIYLSIYIYIIIYILYLSIYLDDDDDDDDHDLQVSMIPSFEH